MAKIAVIGEVLVEIMADTPGNGFDAPMALRGPYPSGAPAIFIDQVARLGQPCGIVSAVGNDDFGRLNLARLAGDGVDVSAVSLDRDRPTGSAFVRYRPDGTRDFVFNIAHSACAGITLTEAAQAMLAGCQHLHIMGTSLFSPGLVAANLAAARQIKSQGGTVSFDPNLRKEMAISPDRRADLHRILAVSDVYLPSGDELFLLTTAQDEPGAMAEIIAAGPRVIVHKRGAAGLVCHAAGQDIALPAYPVDAIDPTGAGDCCGAAFVTMWLRGADLPRALTIAAAAGAQAVTQRGPMEGTATLAQLDDFIARSGPLI